MNHIRSSWLRSQICAAGPRTSCPDPGFWIWSASAKPISRQKRKAHWPA
jgi:hypothetical protein